MMKLGFLTETHERLAKITGVDSAFYQLEGVVRYGWTYAVEVDGHRWEATASNPDRQETGAFVRSDGNESIMDVRYQCLAGGSCADCHQLKTMAGREAALRVQLTNLQEQLDEVRAWRPNQEDDVAAQFHAGLERGLNG